MARIDVIMPQMGESIAEGTLSTWLKKVGDEVKRDEPIFEISTDKVDAEIPSPASGVLAEIMVAGRRQRSRCTPWWPVIETDAPGLRRVRRRPHPQPAPRPAAAATAAAPGMPAGAAHATCRGCSAPARH